MGSVFATVLSGTLVYVLGQIVIRFIIEPMQEQWRVIGQIAEALLYHEYLFAGPEITPQEAKDTTLRFYQLATELMARTAMIPKYDLLAKVSFVRPYTEIVRATKGLNGLSNTLTRADWIVDVHAVDCGSIVG